MATIKAFECIRPDKAVADKVAALPYDVYTGRRLAGKWRVSRFHFLP